MRWQGRAAVTLASFLSGGYTFIRIQQRREKSMSTIAQKKLLTAEEFLLLPDPGDGSQQELVRGEIVTMPPPGGMHGVCCMKTGRRLGNFVEENNRGTMACNDTGFITERDPDSVRGLDISYWSIERLKEVPVG